MNIEEQREFLIESMLRERSDRLDIPQNEDEQNSLLRALFNTRPASKASEEFLKIQDAYLKARISENGITDSKEINPVKGKFCIWQGDITTLKCDAIVNAANSGLTGCWIPNHKCIDNCIHTFAGVQLRFDCAKIIESQGFTEPFGQAKITDAYNLPCKKIIHTVGPIVQGKLTQSNIDCLKSCYESCLSVAAKHGIESIAFCCISTGEFHFPNKKAAEIAVSTCETFLQSAPTIKKVIFNVFLDIDKQIYEELLLG